MSEYLEKPLPSAPEAERVILGAILLDNTLFPEAQMSLRESDFYSPLHRRVFKAMCEVYKQSLVNPAIILNPILIGEELRKIGQLENIGGIAAITNLTFGLPHFAGLATYIVLVKEKAQLRNQIKIYQGAIEECLAEEKRAVDIAGAVSGELLSVTQNVGRPRLLKRIVESVRERMRDWLDDTKQFAIPSPIPELNAVLRLGGYAPKDLIFVAARPSIGKTAFMLDCLAASALAGFPSLGFSLEMSEEDLVMRMIPQRAGVRNLDIKPALYRKNEKLRARVDEALTLIEDLPVELQSETMLVEHIVSISEIAVKRRGIRFIAVDFLQLMDAISKQKRRDLDLEYISLQLKNLAKRLNVPILCLAQLNRASEIADRRPEMSDIREAGASEQIADLIIMPYREVSRRKENGKKKPLIMDDEEEEESSIVAVNLFIAKQRNGPAGFDVKVDFDMDYQRYMSTRLWSQDTLKKLNYD